MIAGNVSPRFSKILSRYATTESVEPEKQIELPLKQRFAVNEVVNPGEPVSSSKASNEIVELICNGHEGVFVKSMKKKSVIEIRIPSGEEIEDILPGKIAVRRYDINGIISGEMVPPGMNDERIWPIFADQQTN